MSWDLWIDFQRADNEGLTLGNTRNVRDGATLHVGDVIVVGNEYAEPGVAEVVELGDRGVVVVKVFPGTVGENRHRLSPGFAPGS